MLSLYRQALRIRRADACLGGVAFEWIDSSDGALAFRRGTRFACMVNLSDTPVALLRNDRVLLASDRLADGLLPPETAVWLRIPAKSRKSAKNCQ